MPHLSQASSKCLKSWPVNASPLFLHTDGALGKPAQGRRSITTSINQVPKSQEQVAEKPKLIVALIVLVDC